MTEVEKLALAVALLTANIHQLFERVEKLHREVQDLTDIFRGCACFGTGEPVEVKL